MDSLCPRWTTNSVCAHLTPKCRAPAKHTFAERQQELRSLSLGVSTYPIVSAREARSDASTRKCTIRSNPCSPYQEYLSVGHESCHRALTCLPPLDPFSCTGSRHQERRSSEWQLCTRPPMMIPNGRGHSLPNLSKSGSFPSSPPTS